MKNSFIVGHAFERAVSGDEDTICQLLALAFGFGRDRALEYVAHAGLSSFRILRTDPGRAAATAALLKTAHCFGGSDVPAASIAHVAIAPEARGRDSPDPWSNRCAKRRAMTAPYDLTFWLGAPGLSQVRV